MQPYRHNQSYTPLGIFLCASCVVNALLLWGISALPSGDDLDGIKMQERSSAQATQVRMVDESMLPKRLRRAERVINQTDVKKEKKKKRPNPDDQLPYVTQDSLIKEQQPVEARFSGKKANRVDRDTQRKAKPGAAPRKQPLASLMVKGERSGVETPSPTKKERVQQKPSTSRPELEASSIKPDIVLPGGEPSEPVADPGELLKPSPSSLPKKGSDRGAATGKASPQTLFPTMAQRAKMAEEIGDGGSFHYLKDVAEGDVTMLNQKRNRYWSFWDRMTRKVRREWRPGRELRKRDPYGNIYGVGTFYTRVEVTLDSDGSIHKLRVAQSSKLDFIDDEAVEALLNAGPYPNPPEGMKDGDGLIHFYFGFNFEVISGGKVRLFNIKPEDPF